MSATEADLHRRLARALDARAELDWWRELDISTNKLDLTWTHGSKVAGYDNLRLMISKNLESRWPELLSEAIAELDRRVAEARAALFTVQTADYVEANDRPASVSGGVR